MRMNTELNEEVARLYKTHSNEFELLHVNHKTKFISALALINAQLKDKDKILIRFEELLPLPFCMFDPKVRTGGKES